AAPRLFERASLAAALRAQDDREQAERRAEQAASLDEDGRALSFTALDTYARCPARYRYRYVLGLPELAPAAPPRLVDRGDAYDDAIGADEYGTLIHLALERYNRRRVEGLPADLLQAFEAQIGELGLRSRIAPARLAAARSALQAYLRHPIAQARVLGAEVAFNIDFAGVTVRGAVDLVAELGEQALIVDYKTGAGPTGHYALQLAIYREAARHIFGERDWQSRLLILRDGDAHELQLPEIDAAARVSELASGIARLEFAPSPGAGCAACPFRAQPCTASNEPPGNFR
ncbi:MAG: PD-(D/E)XK nuclease family protein, partial [bacterium]|nr:PD-(D/E)XK nuclease family protein [bacterium]